MADINYAKNYGGADRQFASSYIGAITKTPIIHYIGGWTKTYSKLYTKAYEGAFGANYGKQYDGVWTGVY